MRDGKSFAQRALGSASVTPIREALGKERQFTGRAAELELRMRDGRRHEALSWGLYQRRLWLSGADSERLDIIFSTAVVSIAGSNLQRLSEMIREERLTVVQEQDDAEARLLEEENRQVDAPLRKAIVTNITIEPAFDRAVLQIQTQGDLP